MALPTIAREGVARSAANIDSTWIGLEVECFLTDRLGRPVHVLNDADAAGLAEVRYGAGRGPEGRPARGTVLVLLLGTGIGSALFVDGWLVPNLELGHLELLLSPDLIVVGGAISARHEDFLPHLHLNTPIVPAQLSNATHAMDRLRTTGESHHRCMVAEVMGRDVGWLALLSGMSAGAHAVLIPEQ